MPITNVPAIAIEIPSTERRIDPRTTPHRVTKIACSIEMRRRTKAASGVPIPKQSTGSVVRKPATA